jgi:magnesium chelatase family protein
MESRVFSAGVIGVDGYLVEVECDTGPGLNSFEVVDLAETAVRESRARIRSAVSNCGYDMPRGRIPINLGPANVPKRGPIYDLKGKNLSLALARPAAVVWRHAQGGDAR